MHSPMARKRDGKERYHSRRALVFTHSLLSIASREWIQTSKRRAGSCLPSLFNSHSAAGGSLLYN